MNNFQSNPGFCGITGRPQSRGRFNPSKRLDGFPTAGYNSCSPGGRGMAYSSFSTVGTPKPNMTAAYGNGGNPSAGRRLGSFGGGRCSVQSPAGVGGGYGKFNNQLQQQLQRPMSSSSNTNCNYNNPQMSRNNQMPRGVSSCPPKPRCPSGIVPGAAAPNLVQTKTECSPIMVNIPASQIQNAKNTSYFPDRQEPGGESGSNEDMKYIPLKWDDILGQTGLNGLRVSMLPPASGDGGAMCNPNANRQLKVSFGGQRGRPEQGETQLKVVSIQPIAPGGMPPTAAASSSSAAAGGGMPQNNYYNNNNNNYGGMMMPQGQGQQQVYGASMAASPTMPTMMNMNSGNNNNNCNCPNCRK